MLLSLPGWLTDEKYVTLATWGLVLVTFCLDIATGLLYRDGKIRSKEQNERWRRDDEIAKESAKPKAFVELATKESTHYIYIVVYNLHASAFLVDPTTVRFKESSQTSYRKLPVPCVLLSGQSHEFEYHCPESVHGNRVDGAVEVKLVNTARETVTAPVPFYISLGENEKSYSWALGCLADRLPGVFIEEPRRLILNA